MTWSTEGMSKPRAATSVAMRIPFGDDAKLFHNDGESFHLLASPKEKKTVSLPVQVLQSLFLLQLRVQGIHGHLEHLEEGNQPADSVDTPNEDERPSGISQKEVVQVKILFVLGAHQLSLESPIIDMAYLLKRHTLDHTLSQSGDQTAFWRDVNDFWLGISEIQFRDQIVQSVARVASLFTLAPATSLEVALQVFRQRRRKDKGLDVGSYSGGVCFRVGPGKGWVIDRRVGRLPGIEYSIRGLIVCARDDEIALTSPWFGRSKPQCFLARQSGQSRSFDRLHR